MKNTKVIKELIQDTTVNENGEILQESKKVTYSIGREPDFVKLYLSDLITLEGLPKSTATVFYELLKHMTYADSEGGQIIALNPWLKKQILIASKTISSTQTISNAVSALKKKGILIEIGQSTYRVNPNIIGKGDWRDISELRMNITYNKLGRFIETNSANIDKTDESVSKDISA